MTRAKGTNRPTLTEEGRARAEAQRARLARALRENLKKRKAQQRAREMGRPPAKGPATGGKEG